MSILTSTRRLNPLTKDYVLVSPIRLERPWGQKHDVAEDILPEYEPNCYLCPGNKRAKDLVNPNYQYTFHFENDFPSLSPIDTKSVKDKQDQFFTEHLERGKCEVICYSHKHDTNFFKLSQKEIVRVLDLWQDRYTALSNTKHIQHIQIFETRGNELGNSSPHPHCQIWAQEHIPTIPKTIQHSQAEYFKDNQQRLLLDYINTELEHQERVVGQVGDFVLIVPFWAEWPYETYILCTKPLSNITQLTTEQKKDLAQMLANTTQMYAQFFERPKNGAPYMMSISQAPTLDAQQDATQLFFRYITPLLNPSRQKYQAGYEKSAETQRDFTPETAAKKLKPFFKKIK